MNGAVPGAQSFASALTANGDTTWYTATNGTSWETGLLTRTSASVYARTTIYASSNADAVVNFASGSVDVFIDLPASKVDTLNLTETTVTSAATFDIGAVQSLRILASGTTGPVTSLGTSPNKLRIVRWSGAILTHHATSLILLGGINRTTAAGDIGIYASDASGNWRELNYQRAARIPSFSVHRNGADQTGLATGVFTKIQFTTKEFDTNSFFDNATNYRYTPLVPGKYLISLAATFTGLLDGTVIALSIEKNGARLRDVLAPPGGASGDGGTNVTALVDMNGSTDYIEGFAYHTAGSNKSLYGNSNLTWMTGVWIGP